MGILDTVGQFFLGKDNYNRIVTGRSDTDRANERSDAEWEWSMTRQRATMDNSLQNSNLNRIAILTVLGVTGIALVIVVWKRS